MSIVRKKSGSLVSLADILWFRIAGTPCVLTFSPRMVAARWKLALLISDRLALERATFMRFISYSLHAVTLIRVYTGLLVQSGDGFSPGDATMLDQC
jgi:hypothetical protein